MALAATRGGRPQSHEGPSSRDLQQIPQATLSVFAQVAPLGYRKFSVSSPRLGVREDEKSYETTSNYLIKIQFCQSCLGNEIIIKKHPKGVLFNYLIEKNVYFISKPTINNATILATLIMGLIEGPAVSL